MTDDAAAAQFDLEICCPVCRARQSARPECRRCAADLTLLVHALESGRVARERLVQATTAGDQASVQRLRRYLAWLEGA